MLWGKPGRDRAQTRGTQDLLDKAIFSWGALDKFWMPQLQILAIIVQFPVMSETVVQR